MREFFVEKQAVRQIVDFGDLRAFENAMTYVSIFFVTKRKNSKFTYARIKELPFIAPIEFDLMDIQSLSGEAWSLGNNDVGKVLGKIINNASCMLSSVAKPSYGIVTGKDDVLMFDLDEKVDIEDELILPVIRAQGCDRYSDAFPSKKVVYPYEFQNSNTSLIELDNIKTKFPKMYKYIMENSVPLKERKDSRNLFGNRVGWYGLVRFGQLETFMKPKIVTPGEVKHNKFCIDNTKSGFTGARVFAITVEDETVDIRYLLALSNSKVVEFFMHHTASLKAGGYYSYSTSALEKIPIIIADNQNEYIELVDEIMEKKRCAENTTALENQIEEKIFGLYELNDEEIDIIRKDLED